MVPQVIPPINSFLFSIGLVGAEDIFLWSKNRMTGSRATEPRKERIQLKENGPIASPPSDCATKAMPQINAVKINKNVFCVF